MNYICFKHLLRAYLFNKRLQHLVTLCFQAPYINFLTDSLKQHNILYLDMLPQYHDASCNLADGSTTLEAAADSDCASRN